MVGPSATCSRHPLREAVGVCMRCSQSFCTDCLTKLDGINHCRVCLSKMGREVARAQADTQVSRVPPALAIAAGVALLSLLAWGMLEVLLPGSFGP